MQETKLYHYTSLDAFHKIMTGNLTVPNNKNEKEYMVMHATHIRYMNDMMEYVYFKNLLWEAVKGDRDIPESKFETYMKRLCFIPDPYVLSFSENCEFLPMWQMYANNATGLMLEFNKENLEKAFPSLSRCLYEKCIDVESAKDLTTTIRCNSAISAIFDLYNIRGRMSLYKAPDYKYENEWRICCHSDKCHTKISNGMIKPYTEIAIPIDCLERVVIGPCATNKEQIEYAIQTLLKAKKSKKDIAICTSSINSYRNNI